MDGADAQNRITVYEYSFFTLSRIGWLEIVRIVRVTTKAAAPRKKSGEKEAWTSPGAEKERRKTRREARFAFLQARI
jgi:hypothetical protein